MKKITKKQKAFTVVEIVTVVTIISILVGILLPSITAVKKGVLETKEKAQIATLGLAIQAFKNESGDYPPSDWHNMNGGAQDYCGAQMLAEALLGWDLLGFHPKSSWRSDGRYPNGNRLYELANDSDYTGVAKPNIEERIGPYLDRAEVKVFQLQDYNFQNLSNLEDQEGHVISDVYRYKKITDQTTQKRVVAGLPVLYYKAKPQHKKIDENNPDTESIYDYQDNHAFIRTISYQDEVVDKIRDDRHKLFDYQYFYEYIRDPKVGDINIKRTWQPFKADSYLLISAGYDGEYGTDDDITNFK